MSADPRIVIVGAGPTGLGAAWRLHERGHTNWELYEAVDHPGGLATSVVDARGFTWDMGGHVLFSHYPYFDDLMVKALGEAWVEHVREAWVWMRDRWIPYPFQNNIWRLPEEELLACLNGLIGLGQSGQPETPTTFRDWLLAAFGPGICETFMFPYNRKVWAYDPVSLDVGWMGERVATVDLRRVLSNLVLKRDDAGWGPNSTFRFPFVRRDRRHLARRGRDAPGGTRALQSRRDRNRHLEAECQLWRWERRAVRLHHLDRAARPSPARLAGALRSRDARRPIRPFIESHRRHRSCGNTSRRSENQVLDLFPESHVPFYRATVFSNYSPNNVPASGAHWSLMAEVSESPEKPVDERAGRERSRSRASRRAASSSEAPSSAPGIGVSSTATRHRGWGVTRCWRQLMNSCGWPACSAAAGSAAGSTKSQIRIIRSCKGSSRSTTFSTARWSRPIAATSRQLLDRDLQRRSLTHPWDETIVSIDLEATPS